MENSRIFSNYWGDILELNYILFIKHMENPKNIKFLSLDPYEELDSKIKKGIPEPIIIQYNYEKIIKELSTKFSGTSYNWIIMDQYIDPSFDDIIIAYSKEKFTIEEAGELFNYYEEEGEFPEN
jgi:hypothetical protein